MPDKTGQPRALSIQGHLLLLVVAILVPGLVFAGILLTRYAEAERTRIELDARDTVRDLVVAIDRQLGALRATMHAVGVAPVVRSGDLAEVHAYLSEVAVPLGAAFTLRDVASQQLVGTRVPWGTPLPDGTSLRDIDDEVRRLDRTVISNLYRGIIDRRQLFAVVAPVRRLNESGYVLALSMPVTTIGDIVNAAQVPDVLLATVVDRRNILIARSQRAEEFVGTPARTAVRGVNDDEGVLRDENIEGVRTVMFYRRSELTGWLVAVSVPQMTLDAPLHRSLWTLTAIGSGLITLSLVIATLLGRRITAPVQALARDAAALASGAVPSVAGTSVREVRAVAEALAASAITLRQRTAERDRAEAALREVNASLESQVTQRTAELVAEMKRREEVEDRLRHVQKIEALGQLTGGIAHDFNNMLAVVLGSLRLVERRLAKGETNVQRFIDSAREGAERAATLTSRLLAFSRQQPLAPATLDANKLVTAMSVMLRRTISEDIKIETVLAGGLWRVHADQTQLESAILNLAVNARDAMPGGGRLTIETANAFLDEAYAANHPEVSAGQYTLIAVSDTGAGMSASVAAQAFDPFFTTKPPGQGTGMGLSQVYGFIKQSGGHAKIYSEIGQGTTVKLYLPRFVGEQEAPAKIVAPAVAAAANGDDLVLVVEDEASVRAMTVASVRELGYRVLEADGAAAALALLEAHPDVTLLFTDIVMPDTNGRKLADEARRRWPGLKVLFTTGYTRNAIVHNGLLDAGVQLIVKPFTLEALGLKLREVLARAADLKTATAAQG